VTCLRIEGGCPIFVPGLSPKYPAGVWDGTLTLPQRSLAHTADLVECSGAVKSALGLSRKGKHKWPTVVFHPAVHSALQFEARFGGYTTVFGLSDAQIDFDAPTVRLCFEEGTWFVLAEDYCPAPGPGVFVDEWTTPDEAVDDILDFYFGNPQRMKAKADALAHQYRSPRE